MIRIRQIKIPVLEDSKEKILQMISKKIHISKEEVLDFNIIKKSIDARDKNDITYVYEVDATLKDEKKIHFSNDVIPSPIEEYHFVDLGLEELKNRVVVVGSGPAGLFCTYMLASFGYQPILLERGEKIEDRVKSVEHFFETNELNVNSNIQFGEGGAGTFSDGKLNTLVKDKANRGKKVFEIFVENGAPKEILYEQKPHIGTDLLRKVIISIREKILSMGGEIHYNSLVTDFMIQDNHITGVEVNHKETIPTDVLVLAIGHSARDTFYLLKEKGLLMKQKNFAIGFRMEHPQKMINESQYGKFSKVLPPASYKLTHTCSDGRGVYSFCMCPGGFVVNASSEEGRLAVNGMSNYKRDEKNANSAIVATITSRDVGEELFAGLEFQRKLEEKAYQLGNGFIPIQLYGDFLDNKKSVSYQNVIPNTKGKYYYANLRELFSDELSSCFIEAISDFGNKIKGFDRRDAIISGIESRTSSPIIIVRGEEGESSISGIYPCGEGAGYAGGITTAAMDGIKVAEWIAKKYRSLEN